VWKADCGELSAAASKVAERKLGENMRKVLQLVNSRSQTTAADVVIHLGIEHSTARQYLHRLANEHGLITRLTAGAYGPVTVSQVSREEDRAGSGDDESADLGDSGDVAGVSAPSQDEVSAPSRDEVSAPSQDEVSAPSRDEVSAPSQDEVVLSCAYPLA